MRAIGEGETSNIFVWCSFLRIQDGGLKNAGGYGKGASSGCLMFITHTHIIYTIRRLHYDNTMTMAMTIQVLNCQNCNQCLKCHNSLGLLSECVL